MIAELSPLSGIAMPGRHGNPEGPAGVIIAERVGLGIATLAARRGRGAELATAVAGAYGVALPSDSRVARGERAGFIGTGPGQWLAVSEALAYDALALDLAARLSGLASISDQSDGRAVVRISGARARDVLAKGLPIDLDGRVFAPDSAATSSIALMGVTLWQVDDAPTYDIVVFRSLAGSFWKWLADSAAEFGFTVEAPRG